MSPRSALPLRIEYVLLGLVRRQPTYGYELLQRWNEPNGISLIWRLKPGTVYAALEKLEQMGYLDSSLIPGESSPPRKEHRITSAGEEAFLHWMETPVSATRDFRQDFLARLFFRQDVSPVVVKALFTQQKSTCQEWLVSLGQQLNNSAEFERSVVSFRICQVQGILKWLKELAGTRYDLSSGE